MATIRKTIERMRGKRFMRVHLELRENDSRGLSDGFSVTADLYEPHGTWDGRAQYSNGRDPDSMGAMLDEITRFFPNLAPLVELHLADPDGTPLHAIANGWYFYSGRARQYEESHGDTYSNREGLSDYERAARALNIPVTELPEDLDQDGFKAFAESLRGQWADKAATARALLETL